MNHLRAVLSFWSIVLLLVLVSIASVSCQVDRVVANDLVADETTIIFRPLFVYRKQQADAEKRRKLREEWQKQHPNSNYYDYVNKKTGGQ